MKYIIVLLALLGSAAAQSRVGADVATGDFDELFAVAPHCKDMAIKFMNSGIFKVNPNCQTEVLSAIHGAGTHLKTVTEKEKKYGAIAAIKLIQHEQQLLLDEMLIDMDTNIIGPVSQTEPVAPSQP